MTSLRTLQRVDWWFLTLRPYWPPVSHPFISFWSSWEHFQTTTCFQIFLQKPGNQPPWAQVGVCASGRGISRLGQVEEPYQHGWGAISFSRSPVLAVWGWVSSKVQGCSVLSTSSRTRATQCSHKALGHTVPSSPLAPQALHPFPGRWPPRIALSSLQCNMQPFH